jgi:phosphogluconate dehydratase
LRRYTQEPKLDGDSVMWQDGTTISHDTSVLRGVEEPFDTDGGLKTLAGNLGSCVIKTSAVKPEHRTVTAPAVVFDDQAHFLAAFQAGELDRDLIAVLRYQVRARSGCRSYTSSLRRWAFSRTGATGRTGDRRQDVGRLRKSPRGNPSHPKLRRADHWHVQDGDTITLDAVAGTLTVRCGRRVRRSHTDRSRAGARRVRRHRT